MRDHQRAAGEVGQRLLEHAERHQVEIVGRLVEDQEVAAAPEQPRQLHAVALAARERADRRVGEAIVEQHHAQEGAHVDRAVVEKDVVVAVGDLLQHGLVVAQRRARLIEVREARVDARRPPRPRRAEARRAACAPASSCRRRWARRRRCDRPASSSASGRGTASAHRRARACPRPCSSRIVLPMRPPVGRRSAIGPARLSSAVGAAATCGVEAIDARLLLGAARLRPAPDPVELAPHERRAAPARAPSPATAAPPAARGTRCSRPRRRRAARDRARGCAWPRDRGSSDRA